MVDLAAGAEDEHSLVDGAVIFGGQVDWGCDVSKVVLVYPQAQFRGKVEKAEGLEVVLEFEKFSCGVFLVFQGQVFDLGRIWVTFYVAVMVPAVVVCGISVSIEGDC